MLCRGDQFIFEPELTFGLRRASQKCQSRTLEDKYRAICELEAKTKTATVIANEMAVPISTLCTWNKNAAAIKEAHEKSLFCRNRKTMRQSKFNDVEQALLDWIKLMKNKGIKLNSKVVEKKSGQIATMLGYSLKQFKISRGWMTRFRSRNEFNPKFDKPTHESPGSGKASTKSETNQRKAI